ncbi:hypothetical protein MMC14_005088 [Varicellaria rhodocarpa]|nr:hypothetical protein [Varicellaria rhodocarpa]
MFHHLGNCYYRGSLSKRTFAFDKIAVKLQKKKKAFRLLVDIPDHFEDITDPSVDWSLELDLNNNNKARHLSWMLVVMKKVSEVQRPPNANNLLQIQRWNFLSYFQYLKQSKIDVWNHRFSASSIIKDIIINQICILQWMKKPAYSIPLVIGKTADAIAADALSSKEYWIVWNRALDFSGKEYLDYALQGAQKQQILIPSDMQILQVDPRLLRPVAAFKDSIRRLFNCQKLRIDIQSLDLDYVPSQSTSGSQITKDILTDD